LLCLARSIWVPWTPPSKRSCPTVAYLIIGGSGADALSQTNRDRAVYRGDAAAMGVRAYMSSADKPSPPIGNAAAKVFAADADRFLTFLWELQGCNVDRYRYSKVIIPAPNVALPSHSPVHDCSWATKRKLARASRRGRSAATPLALLKCS
jgi:hypothetical protein